jgi:hypothetical protein
VNVKTSPGRIPSMACLRHLDMAGPPEESIACQHECAAGNARCQSILDDDSV